MTRLFVAAFAVLLFGFSASADWGNGQDIADQWRGGRTAYGGSGNPYSGGYDGGYYDGNSGAYYRGYPRYRVYRKAYRGAPVRHGRSRGCHCR